MTQAYIAIRLDSVGVIFDIKARADQELCSNINTILKYWTAWFGSILPNLTSLGCPIISIFERSANTVFK